MKKKMILMMIILIEVFLFSIPQNSSIAQEAAEKFLLNRSKSTAILDAASIRKNDEILFYLFHLETSGFITVNADNDLPPILMYSFNNTLNRESNLLQMLKTDIILRKKSHLHNPEIIISNQQKWDELLNGNRSRDFQQWPAETNNTITDGWLNSRWHQSGIYDDFCPNDNSGERSKVGCVATAMAQIVNFHKFIGDPIIHFNNSDDYYAGGGIDIDDDFNSRDFPSFPELNGYMMDLWNHYEFDVELTDTDKAALSFACAVTVEMQFSSNGSSASTNAVGYNLRNEFDFDDAFYYSYSGGFYDNLREDMLEMRPAQLSIYNPEQQIGHSIVCDGYNTDGYFHLNRGWGISNETSWYLLPTEIPDGYSIVQGGVLDIEGGEIPVNVTGNVSIAGASTPGTYITLDGEFFYEAFVTLYSGDFEFPAVAEGNYIATAYLNEDRDYFQTYEVYIDENNNVLQFDLDHFEGVSGNIIAPISSENCNISFYQNYILIGSGTADENGDYFVPNILPGDYVAMASLSGNYFEQKEVTITADDQTEDFNLLEYQGDLSISYADFPVDTWNFVPNFTLTCAVKFTADELENFSELMISKIRFKAPINNTEGEIFAQIWIDDYLISETEVTEFSYGEWIETNVENIVPVLWSDEFYIGYKITSSTGEFAFYDDGPRVVEKGAFYRNTGWTELPEQNDYNFCIDAVLVTQDFGSIFGNIDLVSETTNITDAVVQTEIYRSRPDEDGNYQIDIPAGIYDLTASALEYYPQTIENLEIVNDQILENIDFELVTVNSAENELPKPKLLLSNFPNPFNPSTTISFSLFCQETDEAKIIIYNLKGQKVRVFSNLKISKSPNQQIIWDGTDTKNNPVSSGIYLAKLQINGKTLTSHRLLLLK